MSYTTHVGKQASRRHVDQRPKGVERHILNIVLSSPRRDLSERYALSTTCYNRFQLKPEASVIGRLLKPLSMLMAQM